MIVDTVDSIKMKLRASNHSFKKTYPKPPKKKGVSIFIGYLPQQILLKE